MVKRYELIVIGSGPAGEKAAVKAAYFGHSVALIEREPKYGGAGVHTGTIPSKTLKETALFLSGKKEQGLYGVERRLEHEASVKDFLFRKDLVTESLGKEVRENIEIHGVEIFQGEGSLVDDHQVTVNGETLYGENIIIATGSYPVHPPNVPFDEKRIHDSDSILEIQRFPKSICIVGAGVIGIEYATVFATMGCKVFLVNRHASVLPFLDPEVTDHLLEQIQAEGVELVFENDIESVSVPSSDEESVEVTLKEGGLLHVDMYLYAAGRNGNIKGLNLEKVGVKVNEKRELIEVDDKYQTNIPSIWAVGDVIGFPALASTSMDQGRAAVSHIFGTHDIEHIAKHVPYGIYTIPEVSTVGLTAKEAKEQGMEVMEGVARHRDMARGQIMGLDHGFLKVVFTKNDLIIRGVHIIGALATELIHFGMLLVQDERSVMDVVSAVFNHPTLHDLYKYACYDGLSGVKGKKVKP